MRAYSMKSITFPTCMAVMTVASITATTHAGGFATAQFGGAHGNAASDSLTSIFYNPAGLALGGGTRAYVEALTAYRTASYARSVGAVDDPNAGAEAIEANTGAAKLANMLASPFAAIATEVSPGLVAAVGVYVPFGGQADWSKVDKWKNNQTFPGAVDGPQRWSVVTGKQQSIFYSGAVAYRSHDQRLAFGASINIVQSAINLTRARNIDGTDTLRDSSGNVVEGRSLLDVSNIGASVGLGFIAQVNDDTKIGVSYQSQPIGGEQKLDGTLSNKFGETGQAMQQVELRQRLPDSVRVAVEWRHGKGALRAGGDWTHWSVYHDQCLVDRTLPSNCVFLPDGRFDPSAGGNAPLLDIVRDWHDNWGLQGGGSYWPNPNLELSANIRLDTNAIPDSTLEPALMDSDKVITMVGARYTHGHVDVDLTIADAAYQKRTTQPRGVDPMAPSRNPDMAGIFEQNVVFALIGVGVHM